MSSPSVETTEQSYVSCRHVHVREPTVRSAQLRTGQAALMLHMNSLD